MSQRIASVKKKVPQQESPPAAVSVSIGNGQTNGTVSREAIEFLAYLKWEAAGKPCCDGITFWDEAEKELVHGK